MNSPKEKNNFVKKKDFKKIEVIFNMLPEYIDFIYGCIECNSQLNIK